MSGFDPDAYLAKVTRQPPSGAAPAFDPDAYLAKNTKASPAPAGSPLERALAEQQGDVVTVQTPTGPAQFTRAGERFYSPEESAQVGDANGARLKERALEGGLSLLSGGGTMLDELAGANAVMQPTGGPNERRGENPLERYVRTRDAARRDVSRATTNTSPQVQVGDSRVDVLPALGAALPSMLAPQPLGALGRILGGGATATVDQVGRTDADLTKGDVGDFAKDVAGAGGTGLALAGAAEGLTAPLRAIGRGATKQAGLAKDALFDAVQATKDKAVKSAEGAIGGIAAGQGNSMETLLKVVQNPHLFDPSTVNSARAFLASPEGQLMMNRAAMNNLEKLANAAPREAAARLAATDAHAAAAPAAVAGEVAGKLEPASALGDLGAKAWRSLGQRAVLGVAGSALGAGADAALGTDGPGMKYGGLAGLLAGPGAVQFMRNQASSPVVQHSANTLMAALLRGSSAATTSAARAAGPAVNASKETAKKDRQAAVDAMIAVLRGKRAPDFAP